MSPAPDVEPLEPPASLGPQASAAGAPPLAGTTGRPGTESGAAALGLRDATALGSGVPDQAKALERRGRAWLLWSFLLCPCHLPLTLAVLTAVLAGTSFGVVLRDHAWVAGTVITVAWLAGTGYGLRLIRRAERAGGACPTSAPRR